MRPMRDQQPDGASAPRDAARRASHASAVASVEFASDSAPQQRRAPHDLAGRRIVITAQRKADEFAAPLERRGAEVIRAATMSHVPHVDDPELLAHTRALIEEPPDLLVVTTGIGFRGWFEAAEAAGLRERLLDALRTTRIYARGPKARGAVVGAGLEVTWTAASETAEEIKERLRGESLDGVRVAVQHHGAGSDGIDETLRAAGADVVSLVVYRWGPAPDPSAVARAVDLVARSDVDVVAFTAAPGVFAFLDAARASGQQDAVLDMLREGRVIAACVGDTTAAPLRECGVEPIVPTRFRLGALTRLVADTLGGQNDGHA